MSDTLKHIKDDIYKDMLDLYPLNAPLNTQYNKKRYADKYVATYTKVFRDKLETFIEKHCCDDKLKSYDETLRHVMTSFKKYNAPKYNIHIRPVNHYSNPFEILPYTIEYSSAQYTKAFQKRVNTFLETIPELRENIREGIRLHVVENKKSIEILIKNLRAFNINASAKSLPEHKRDAYVKFMTSVYISEMIAFALFLENEYLPHCKNTLGLYGCDQSWYTAFLRQQVNMPVDPEEVYQLGLYHVKCIARDMRELETLHHHKLYTGKFVSAAHMMNKHKSYIDVATKNTQTIMHIPDSYIVPSVNKISKRDELYAPLAYIVGGDPDKNIASKFYLNTHEWKANYESDIKYLIQHEVMPGHGLQLHIAHTAHGHKLDKMFSFNDTVEGWAFYCEELFKEQNTIAEEYSRLNARIERAVRLVVDVAIHHKGWSFNRVFSYMKKYIKGSDSIIRSEIYRYSANPGQACTYFLGMLKIKELRERYIHVANKDFYDAFLSLSNKPLVVIEHELNQVIQSNCAKPKPNVRSSAKM
jgi:uncharacterized protein (DUF885 family)